MLIPIERQLLTDFWTAEADELEASLRAAGALPAACEGCRIILAEAVEDGHLHVTVVKTHETMVMSGWAGPIVQPDGGIGYTRVFDIESIADMTRHIRDMLAAPKI